MEPVTATIKDYVAGAKVDTFNKQDYSYTSKDAASSAVTFG